MTFRNPDKAFAQAIIDDRLSADPAEPNFAGNYMYMCTNDSGRDTFKHILTRRYLD